MALEIGGVAYAQLLWIPDTESLVNGSSRDESAGRVPAYASDTVILVRTA